jgi:hypothetical protein
MHGETVKTHGQMSTSYFNLPRVRYVEVTGAHLIMFTLHKCNSHLKNQMPEGWHKASSKLSVHKHEAPESKI